MSTHGRRSLERTGKIVSFVAAWGIVGHQVWRTQYGQEPNWMLMGFAASILVPALIPYITSGRWSTGSSEPPQVSASSSSSRSESSGGSPDEQG